MKKWTKFLCCFCFVALAFLSFTLAGCATVGNLKNNNPELIYNGNAAVMVEDHLYYGNAFADYSASDFNYGASAKFSYLARLNTKDRLETEKDFSPKNVEVVSEEVVGQAKTFMFVLGQTIYYATPNTQKGTNENGETSNYYNYTCLYKSNLNGDKKSKLFTTTGEVSKIEALKFENRYYIVMLAGEKLIVIDLASSKAREVENGVKSISIPKTYQQDRVGSSLDWNGDIYFTTDKSAEENTTMTGSVVKKVKVSGGDVKKVSHVNGVTVEFIGREKDILFYKQSNKIFQSDLTNQTGEFAFVSTQKQFYNASSISDINVVVSQGQSKDDLDVKGFVFVNGSALCFVDSKNQNLGEVKLQLSSGEQISSYKVLLVTGQTAYLSTTKAIYKVDLSNVFKTNGSNQAVCSELVVMDESSIYDGAFYAYDRNYIYFFAKLQALENEEVDEANSDANYYLYRTKVDGTDSAENYQLLGKAVNEKRVTK